jgi:hypothetical protein
LFPVLFVEIESSDEISVDHVVPLFDRAGISSRKALGKYSGRSGGVSFFPNGLFARRPPAREA